MGNRVEDGNRAKNWVVQTFSIRGPVFIFAQRMPPSPSSFLSFLCSLVSRGFAFVPRAVFFHVHCPRLPSFLQPWENHIFPSRCRGFLLSGEEDGLWRVFFSSSSFPQKRVLFICVKGNSRQGSLDGLLDGFAWFTWSSWWKFRRLWHLFVSFLCFSFQRIATKRTKNSSTFTFHPFSFLFLGRWWDMGEKKNEYFE